MDSLKWFFGVFSPKRSNVEEKAKVEKEKEMLREYEVLTSMKERAEKVIQLAKDSPDCSTRSELLENVSLSFPPSLIQEPISSRTLNSSGTWRLAVDGTGRFLYSTNNEGLGRVTVYALQTSTQEPLRSFYCNDIYKVRGIAVTNEDDTEEGDNYDEEGRGGFIFVTGDHMVHKYTKEGQFICSFGSCYPGSDDSHCNDPNGLGVFQDCVYVCDSSNERILILSLDLEYIGCISNKRRVESVLYQDDQVNSPSTTDSVSVTSYHDTIASTEEQIDDDDTDAQSSPSPPHQGHYHMTECQCLEGVCPIHPYLKHPEDLVFDRKGNMHVLDSGKAAIIVFAPTLRFQRFIQLQVSELPFPVSMCLFSDYYYIADHKLGQVVVVSMLGAIQHKFAVQSQEKEAGGFVLLDPRVRQSPLGLGVDNSGLIYVSNTCSDQIWVY